MAGHTDIESYCVENGAECADLARNLREGYPEIKQGRKVNVNLALRRTDAAAATD